MNNTVLPPDEAKAIAKLQQLYLKTERKLINEITRKRSLKLVDYAEVAALERVQRILGEMQSESFKYVPLMVETIFQGVNKKDTAGYENARTLTTAQTATSQILVNNLLGQVMEAAAMAQKSAEKWLALGRLEGDEFREAALSAVAEQQVAGASWILAQKNMAVDLEAQGITAFVDRAGRKWSLTDYCNMAVRTTARQSFVAAKLTADDHDLWQIVRIGSTCPLCAVYEGRIYSKSGTNPDYPPLAAAFGKIDPKGANNLENTYLNIHPSCLHSLIKYTTIGKTDEQIQKDKDFSSFEKNPADHDPRTKRQREEYRKKEQNRQKLLNDTRQWNRYRAALGKDCPDYETFLKHKRLDDDLYKKLEKQYREVRREAKKNMELVEVEESHKVRKVNLQYNRELYESDLLKRRVDTFGENPSNTREIFSRIKEILDHRDGTHFEDLSYIFTDTGKSLINKNFDYYDGEKSKCRPTKRMELLRRLSSKRSVIGIHNHPESSVPSSADIYAAWKRKYKYGVVIGHNGIMFKYSVDEDYNKGLSDLYLEILNKRLYSSGVNEVNKISQTLSDLDAAGVHLEVMR